ncbi:transcription activator of gluconeogenesis Ert1p [[Candida] railenensis]|uniref:Transcription activator of gluconeogenesis Ert1p n=1 Tax=[Candida] railenensis TaxID=45579 RepID=A0A9P0QKM6_9ASCO|nr:transcription activator of gluconeogenesis Ert1p [[Candida] railenensis]
MTCDVSRPCERCIQRGLESTCVDAPRKRKKYLADVPPDILQSQDLHGTQFHATDLRQNQSTPAGFAPTENRFSEGLGPIDSSSNPNAHNSNNNSGRKGSNFGNPTPSFLPLPNQLQPLHQLLPSHQMQSSNANNHNYNNNNNNNPNTYNNNHSHPPFKSQKKSNFLSSAADLEYSTLSSILQDNFMHATHSATSTEATPTSIVSPENNPVNAPYTAGNTPSPSNLADIKQNATFSVPGTTTTSAATTAPNVLSSGGAGPQVPNAGQFSATGAASYDNSINQYFLGPTDPGHKNIQNFPDVITEIDALRKSDPSIYRERNSKSKLSFVIGVIEDSIGASDESSLSSSHLHLQFTEPEQIYEKVTKPFSYTPGYHQLIAYLRKRFPKEMLVKMTESMASYRPSFIACTNSLKEGDLIFMEQCFQRTLLTYDSFINVSGTPTIVWRRTGEIAYVGDEFCILTGWAREELISKKKTFIVELLDDKSVLEYFQLFSRIAFGDFLGATMTECTLLTPNKDVKIRTGCMWTLKRDVFGIPMMIIGNFLPIVDN